MRWLLTALFACCLAGTSYGQSLQAIVADTHQSGVVGYQGPVDLVSGAVAAWGTRALSAAFADGSHVGFRVTRNSDNEVCDVLFTTLGGLGNTVSGSGAACANAGPLVTWCNATTVGITQYYDNTGNGRTAVATGNKAVLNCSTGATNWLGAAGYCTAGTVSLPQTVSASSVWKATENGQFQSVVGFDPTASQTGENNSSPNLAFIYGGTTLPTGAATDGTLHAVQSIWAGASSELYIDGSAHTGLSTGTGSSTAHILCYGSGASGADNPFNGIGSDLREVTLWPAASAASFAATLSSLNSNQHTFWGF